MRDFTGFYRMTASMSRNMGCVPNLIIKRNVHRLVAAYRKYSMGARNIVGCFFLCEVLLCGLFFRFSTTPATKHDQPIESIENYGLNCSLLIFISGIFTIAIF
jgi:hypothetical protein